MSKRSALTVLAAIAVTLAGISASEARYRVCNRSMQRVDVAFGYPHPQFGWTSEGWWTIQPGDCRTIMRGELTNRYYYLYATGSEGSFWQGDAAQKGGFFCISQDKFVFHNSNFMVDGELDCARNNLVAKPFVMVDTEGAPNHIHNLSD